MAVTHKEKSPIPPTEEEERHMEELFRERSLRRGETITWYSLSFLPLVASIWLVDPNKLDWSQIFIHIVPYFFITIFVLLVPILVRQIFGYFPLELLRRKILGQTIQYDFYSGPNFEIKLGRSVSASQIGISDEANPRKLLQGFAEGSGKIAGRIYTRAGAYILAGAFIAFVGLGIFFIRTANLPPTDSVTTRVIDLIPSFGFLIPIEFIALFFLRQYRSAMDDFRYYDAVQRNRQDSLAILHMFAENKEITSTKDVLDKMSIYSSAGKIGKEETTDILESRKLYRDEIVILEKVVEALSTIKQKSNKNKD